MGGSGGNFNFTPSVGRPRGSSVGSGTPRYAWANYHIPCMYDLNSYVQILCMSFVLLKSCPTQCSTECVCVFICYSCRYDLYCV